MAKILVLHGPNLNLLGKREKNIYGVKTLNDINSELEKLGSEKGIQVKCLQSNIEGELVNYIHNYCYDYDLLIINPGAYTHTSVAIRDAILGVNIPVIEVHMTNIYKRESFRHKSFIHDIAVGKITGFGADSYNLAFIAAVKYIESEGSK